MRCFIISLLFSSCVLTLAAQNDTARVVGATDSLCTDTLDRYARSTARYQRMHRRLIPNQTALQYAGSIGIMSWGFGWHYGKGDRVETELLVGMVPKYCTDEVKWTLTVRQRWTPWRIVLGSRWDVDPLMGSASICAIFGEDFWSEEPSRYPSSYYGFSNRFRIHLALGQRVRYKIANKKRRRHKSVALYYELGTNELYLISAIPNRRLPFHKTLSLGIGATFEIF